MTDRLVAFVTDAGYLLPSLVCACQLAEADAARSADIAIFTVAVPDEVLSRLQSSLSAYRFQFIPIDPNAYMPPSSAHFREGHVPKTALGRLVLSQYIPPQYQHIIYIDGDTQVCGDIAPLLNYEVPEGKVAAVSESFFLERASAQRSKYLADLGLAKPMDYFNSGVLAFRRATWEQVGPQALDFFFRNPTLCQFHDQSALNAVCLGRRIALAPAYNFHTGFAELGVGGSYPPLIVHFTGREKPWNYLAWPWGDRFAKPYREFLERNSSLTFELNVNFAGRPKQFARSLYKVMKYRGAYSDLPLRRRIFREYLKRVELKP
jgi:lipopolysaccharide biosynthesis glycosyltransferase